MLHRAVVYSGGMESVRSMFLLIAGTLVVLSGCVQESPRSAPEPAGSNAEICKNVTTARLSPKAQRALDTTISKGLHTDEDAEEDIGGYLRNYSPETQYVMRKLTNNKCSYLGDGHSILRTGILPSLCEDLDALLQQEEPSAATLEHAVWMASKLEVRDVITFLVLMGAPADKYELGM